MDYTNEIFTRLQNGELVEDIAASLTKSLNEAKEKHKAAEAAKRAKAEAKAKEAAINMYKRGMSATDIAEILNEALNKVQQWLGIATA